MSQCYGVPGLQLQAGGNIYPSRVVCLSTTLDNTVNQSASNTSPNIGISQPGTNLAPGFDTLGYAATVNQNIMVFSVGSVAPLELAGTSTRGDILTSDSNGRGLTTTTTADRCIGFLMESGGANDLVQVLVALFVF